jgi:hypothetical protein
MTDGETKKGGHHHVPDQSKHKMSSQIVERRKDSGRRRTDPNTEKLVELVTQVLGSVEGLSMNIGDLRRTMLQIHEEQKQMLNSGGH